MHVDGIFRLSFECGVCHIPEDVCNFRTVLDSAEEERLAAFFDEVVISIREI